MVRVHRRRIDGHGRLTNGVAYTFTVQAKSAAALTSTPSAPSAPVIPIGPAIAPTAVSAVPYNAAVRLTWTPPTDNGGSAMSGYVVTVIPTGGVTTTVTLSSPAAATVISGLTNKVAYRFMVAASTDFGPGTASASTLATKPLATLTLPPL